MTSSFLARFLYELAQWKCTWTCHQVHFAWKGKMAEDTSGNPILREPAQWKCRWTCHQIHFVWKFKGKMAEDHLRGHRFVRACAVEMHMDISQKPFCVKFTRKCRTPRIPHRALTLIVRTPQCGHTVWGKTTHELPTRTPNTDICPFFFSL